MRLGKIMGEQVAKVLFTAWDHRAFFHEHLAEEDAERPVVDRKAIIALLR